MYIGKNRRGQNVSITEESPNRNVIVTGISGTGKSERIADIETKIVQSGGTVVNMDLDGTHPEIAIPEMTNIISAREDGIPLKILDPDILKCPAEDIASFVSTEAEILLSASRAGDRQTGALRDALLFALQHQNNFADDFEAIEAGLIKDGSNIALGVRDKLWSLLRCNVFRKSEKKLQREKINIISLKGLDFELKKVVAEIFLRALWNQIRMSAVTQKITIVIDEFQNMPLGKKSTIFEMLREARKYGVNMILGTQTTSNFSKPAVSAIDQAAVHLYFEPAPSEVKKIAAQITGENNKMYERMLKKLKIGESLVSGDVKIEGKVITYPIIIKTDFAKKETNAEHAFALEKLMSTGG